MFDDIIKKINKTTRRIKKDPKVAVEFLEDVQEILWDLATEPCRFCGQETGEQHTDDCKFALVMEELDYQLLKHRRS